jgi:hypothetical protein
VNPTTERKKSTTRKRDSKAVAAVTDLSALPVVLTIADILAIYRRGESTVRRELQAGTFRPKPFDKLPYRWLRADIERDLERRSVLADNATATRRRRAS